MRGEDGSAKRWVVAVERILAAIAALFPVASAASALFGWLPVPVILLILSAAAVIAGIFLPFLPLVRRSRPGSVMLVSICLITVGAFVGGLTVNKMTTDQARSTSSVAGPFGVSSPTSTNPVTGEQGAPQASASEVPVTGRSAVPTNATDMPPTSTNRGPVTDGSGAQRMDTNRGSVAGAPDAPPTSASQTSVAGRPEVSSVAKDQVSVEVDIVTPANGETLSTLPECSAVRGTVSNLEQGDQIWLMVVPSGSNYYFPQDGPAAMVGASEWSSRACFGSEGPFNILAVIVKADSQNTFVVYRDSCNYNHHCPGVPELWRGVVIVDTVSIQAHAG